MNLWGWWLPTQPILIRFNRRKLEDQRREAAEKEAAVYLLATLSSMPSGRLHPVIIAVTRFSRSKITPRT